MDAVITALDPTTLITIALVAGLVVAIIAIVGLAWALVADRALRNEPSRKALITWIKSRLWGES